MGTKTRSQGKLNQLAAAGRLFPFKRCETKKRIKSAFQAGTESMFWYFVNSMRREG
jgi:hypothetical protein